MRRSRARLAALALAAAPLLPPAAVPAATSAPASSGTLLVGVWPNRLRLLDESSFEVKGEFRTRYGAVVWDSGGYAQTTRTLDGRLYFFITNQMETVEVVDPARRTVVDEVTLSEPGRRVRLFGAAPSPDGRRLYLTARAVEVASDRFVPDLSADVYVYDRDERRVVDSFALPKEVQIFFNPPLRVRPDGGALVVVGADIHEIDPETHEVRRTLGLTRSSRAGYGAHRGSPSLHETEPGVFYSVYFTTDPVLERRVTGLFRFDAGAWNASAFEIGPEMKVLHLALSPDGRRAYLGGNDLVVVDLENRTVLDRREAFERGRPNTSWIVTSDGERLLVSGVGDHLRVYDARSLELLEEVFLGGDAMFAPISLSGSALERTSP